MSKALHRMTHGGARPEDPDYLLHIARGIQGRTVCAFGEACSWPVLSFVDKFKEEFSQHSNSNAQPQPQASSPTHGS
jgi:NADH-quinone oxidoreductase subunit F